MNFDALPGNLTRVRDEIARIRNRAGLRGSLRIVAIAKGHPAAAVRVACAAGLLDIGENRIQEAVSKQDQLADVAVRWHMVGHLQTNKAKQVPGRFALVHSVDSVRLAEALERATARRGGGTSLPVLLQVNVANEAQKSGCQPEEAECLAERVSQLSHLRLAGLMTMAPFTDDEREQRRVFAALRNLRDRLDASSDLRLTELSMGMSSDYPAAVAEGATILRLGTALFGERPR
jgi:pyridoxal phosphate enzyme (YggS family)